MTDAIKRLIVVLVKVLNKKKRKQNAINRASFTKLLNSKNISNEL